ncbi:MAG: ribosomal RNA small subunit methyltransferase H [Phycisphaeraceae bacterium]|nr:MAG: ribosomal RNA small subunit methyltransferase H [Phycisphaeraceae bacterium]
MPVLPAEVLELLVPAAGETYVDCTAGLGGHAAAVGELVGPSGRVVLNDLDPGNLARAVVRVRGVIGEDRVVAVEGNFADLPRELGRRGIRADMVLADLGFASSQMDDPGRGLSFRNDGPLDMRMGPSLPITAAELVATLPEGDMAHLIREFGEEKHARAVARKVVAARQDSPIETTRQLAEIVRSAIPRARGPVSRIDPATRTFQAFRIAVNDELGSLDRFLAAVTRGAASAPSEDGWLAPGARVAVIAFHSLEDRAVKRAFGDLVSRGLGEHVRRGIVQAGEDEVGRNPRARSAKLRVVRLVASEGAGAG